MSLIGRICLQSVRSVPNSNTDISLMVLGNGTETEEYISLYFDLERDLDLQGRDFYQAVHYYKAKH